MKTMRHTLKLSGLTIGVLSAALMGSHALAQDLNVSSPGGLIQNALIESNYAAAENALGINIIPHTTQGLQDIRVQVLSGAVQWSLATASMKDCALAAEQGLLEPIDYSIVDESKIPEAARSDYYVPYFYYSLVMAWPDSYVEQVGKTPQGWADYFNADEFPGRRAVRNEAYGNLEIALIADGVPMDELYPLDVDRALAKWEEIKPHVEVWWDSGAQSVQLYSNREVDLMTIWNGRIQPLLDEGFEGAFTYEGGHMSSECMAIPRGAPNVELANQALNEFLNPVPQAQFAQLTGYGAVNPEAFSESTGVIDLDQLTRYNTHPDNLARQVIASAEWWAHNGAEAEEAWANFQRR